MAFEEPEVETWDSIDRIPHPKIRAFAEFWQAKRGDGRAPARCDIDPSELGAYLPYMYMVDVVQPGPRFKFRLMGTDSKRSTGFDYTGRFADEALPPDYYCEMQQEMNDVLQFVLRYKISSLDWQGRPHARYHRLIMPLSSDQSSVNMLLGVGYMIEAHEVSSEAMETGPILQSRILVGR